MLKKIMKAALAASLVFGMSSFAYAADFSVGGKFRTYFGQYSTGAENYTAHFDVREEANVKFNGKVGKLSVYHELESATNSDYKNTQTRLSYALPFGLLTIGNVTSVGVVMTASTGWSTSNIPNSTNNYLAVTGYSENEGLQLHIPLEGMGFVQFTMYEDSSNYAGYLVSSAVYSIVQAQALAGGATADVAAAAAAASVPSTTEGSSMQLAANLMFGDILVRGQYATAKTDDPASSADDPMTTNNMGFGVKVPLGTMAVGFDYASAKVSYDAWSDDLTLTNMGLSLDVNGIGPGKLIVFYDMGELKASESLQKDNTTSIVFDAPVGKGAGVQLGYIANAVTPEGGDTTTETFMGAGFYASF